MLITSLPQRSQRPRADLMCMLPLCTACCAVCKRMDAAQPDAGKPHMHKPLVRMRAGHHACLATARLRQPESARYRGVANISRAPAVPMPTHPSMLYVPTCTFLCAPVVQSMAELPVRGLLEPELASLNGTLIYDGSSSSNLAAAAAVSSTSSSSSSLDDPGYAPGTQVRTAGPLVGRQGVHAVCCVSASVWCVGSMEWQAQRVSQTMAGQQAGCVPCSTSPRAQAPLVCVSTAPLTAPALHRPLPLPGNLCRSCASRARC